MAVRLCEFREYSEGVVRSRGIEPPRAEPTAPSTLRVYHFRHDRKIRKVSAPGYGYRLTQRQAPGARCLSKPAWGVQGGLGYLRRRRLIA